MKLVVCSLVMVGSVAAAQPAGGFLLAAPDEGGTLRIGGYTQFDGRFFVDDDANTSSNQFGFRSIRPEFLGTVFDRYEFRLLPDFAGSRLVVQEAYVEAHYSAAVKVKLGKFKVPFGLERLQPEIATTFVERGLPSLLVPNRDLGVQLSGDVGIVSYQLGVFNGVADGGSGDTDVSDNKDVAARVFVSPIKELGVGGAVTYGFQHGTVAQTDLGAWRTQGQNTFFAYKTGTTLMDTAVADGRHWRATAQADYYAGPFGVLAEYVRSQQHVALDDAHGLVSADAWQVVGQWVIAGGRSTYKGVVPDGKTGAIDVAARVGAMRVTDDMAFTAGLADATKSARKAFSVGVGVDWLPNKSLRFVLDLERTTFHGGARTGDRPTETTVVGRVQTVF